MKTNLRALLMLAIVLFGTTGRVMATSITYNVNMSVQTALGNFHPGVDTVLVGGTFCNWTTTNVMTQTSDTNIYTLTFNDTADAVGAYENHKFIIDPNGNSSGTSLDRKSTRLNSSHGGISRMPSSA